MKTFLIALSTFVSIVCFGQDMQQYLSETRKMVKEKKYEAALERYIWFQDHALESGPAMTGVRLSFALAYWKDLADLYPPAMTAMKEMRDSKTNSLLTNNVGSNLFADVAALNRTLAEEDKTIQLFENIAKQNPKGAKICWYWAKDALFNAKRYDIIKNYIGNPINEFEVIKKQHELMNAVLKNNNPDRPEGKVHRQNMLVEKSLELIQFSIAINDISSAKAIQSNALTIVNDHRLRDFKIE